MNAKLKSYFIWPAVVASTVLFLIGIGMAVLDPQERTAWLGAAAAALPLPVIAARLIFMRVVRTSENLPLFLLVSSSGLLISGWQQFIEETSGWGPTCIALAGLALLLAYVFWYSRFGRIESHFLSVGSKIPEFELRDTNGEQFQSGQLIGSPAVVLFYRGNWCPLCMAQIGEIVDRYQDLAALGVRVVLVSPQPERQSQSLATQYDVPFTFLVDENNVVAKTLNIDDSSGVPAGTPGGYSGDTVMPTLLVTNNSGTIIYSDQTDNYRVRPEPDLFLAILRRAGVVAQ